MRKLLILFISIAVCAPMFGQKPVQKNVGRLTISVDPRMELLGAAQVMAGYPLTTKNTDYTGQVLEYFAPYGDMDAVRVTDELYKAGFSYDAPPVFMLHLGQPDKLEVMHKYPEDLADRAGGSDNLVKYRNALAEFAKKSKFQKFWKQNKGFYESIIDRTFANMPDLDLVGAMEKYYNEAQNSYNLIICPLFGSNNYGPRIPAGNGKYDIYSCTSPVIGEDGIPYVREEMMIYLTWHEFSHPFVNPLSEKYRARVMANERLFEPIKTDMSRQAYSNWETCVNEHVVRAVVIRLMEANGMPEFAEMALKGELSRKFVYIEQLMDKLKEFENRRDAEGITFTDYYPELLSVFDDLQVPKITFQGPMNTAMMNGKIAWIYPTGGGDAAGLERAQQHVKTIAEKMKGRIGKEATIVISDKDALGMDLSEYGILAYGTLDSNLFLARYKDTFPFRLENGILYADKEYAGKGLRFISCVPNPQNAKLGMVVYTAFDNADIYDINNIRHGGTDYLIYVDKNNIVQGNYKNKDAVWKF